MSFGFSAGDFINGLALIKDLIGALKDSAGSSAEYIELIGELYCLERAFTNINTVPLHPELFIHKAALDHAISLTRRTIEEFLERISKYALRLRLGGSLNVWKDAWRKIEWRLCRREDVLRFRSEIALRTQSIQTLLNTVQLHAFHLISQSLREQSVEISHNRSQLDGVLTLVQTSHTVHLQTRNTLKRIESSLPRQILRQPVVTLFDARNRHWPIDLEWTDSLEAFIAVLATKFTSSGAEKVRRRESILQDAISRDEIDLTQPWVYCLSPGQTVDMSMTFRRASSTVSPSCPVCFPIMSQEVVQETSSEPEVGEIECPLCKRRIRRVIEIDNNQMLPVTLPPPTIPSPDESHLPISSLANVRACGDIKDYRRINFTLTGDEIPVYGTCFRCSYSIVGFATLPITSRNSVELLCPACNDSFCEVGLRTDVVPGDLVPPELRIICICGGDAVHELIACQACDSWQHRSCYYTTGVVPSLHKCHQCTT